MLTVDDYLSFNDYSCNNSPESCSSNSYSTDSTDFQSDEDFMQKLSSELDIPLLLNPGEDEINLLNSFFDKSPEEIMAEITAPAVHEECHQYHTNGIKDLQNFEFGSWDFNSFSGKIKSESSDSGSSSAGSFKSNSPAPLSPKENVPSPQSIKEEIKTEPLSPQSIVTNGLDVNNLVLNPVQIQLQKDLKFVKQPTKKVPIQPKSVPYTVPNKNKIIVMNNSNLKLSPVPVVTGAQNVVVLENYKTVPIPKVTIPPIIAPAINGTENKHGIATTMMVGNRKNGSVNINIDPKVLKWQQRKMRNRESASLSRKKKKDYLTSLENQVKELTDENRALKVENLELKERLTKYEGNNYNNNSISSSRGSPVKNIKNSVVLCMFLLTIGFNLEHLKNPFYTRNSIDVTIPSNPNTLDHHNRHLLWSAEEMENNSTTLLPFSMCPAAVNQTESARLALELERWIGKPKGTANNITSKPPLLKSRSLRKRKKKYENRLVPYKAKQGWTSTNNELQVFTPEQLYHEFFEAINRQDDTFYVVSFSDHHMLLPALHHNKTRRPKMSLIMPSVIPNGNNSRPTHVPLMQIDCEVLDTRLIQIRYGSIPQHLRAQGNSTRYGTENGQDNFSNHKADTSKTNYTEQKAYKPFFISRNDNSGVFNLN